MLKSSVSALLFLSLCVAVAGRQAPASKPQTPQASPAQQTQSAPKPDGARPDSRAAEPDAGFIAPADVNVRIGSDPRTFVVMAALNAGGFDYEPSGHSLSPARVELRKDLVKASPEIKAKLAEFYKSHRRPGVDEAVDAMRYAALSLLMTAPPAFSIDTGPDKVLPEDLRALLDFVPLVREFYVSSGIRELVPKYTSISDSYAAVYRRPVGELIYDLLDYFHTAPATVIEMRPFVATSENDPKNTKTTVISRNRTRQVFIVPDPLGATNTAAVRGDILNQKEDLLTRRVGDDYVVIVGPSRTVTLDPVRQALIRFVIDPLVERNLKFALESKDQFLKLVAAVPTASKQYAASVYLVIRESIAQASEARLKRIAAGPRGSYTEEDAVYDLAQAYLRGAVLSFHFYESLIGFERVGIKMEDFFEQMLATIKWEKEAARAKDFEAVVAKVAEKRARAPKPEAERPEAASPIVKKILASDDLIRQRRFDEARPVLEEVLSVEPKNARALYGMARVMTQTPSKAELDANADENDKIQAQHERLKVATRLFRDAIANAAPEGEAWLVQWSYVYLGRIFDFQEFRVDAVVEYEKAIAMGPVAGGALKEALEGKEKPFAPKQ